jgi:uncharacterized integral membrane protein (TIGR00698 family)
MSESLQRYGPGVALTLLLAIASTMLAKLPYASVMGPLTMALILGIGWRATAGLPEKAGPGTAISGKKLLRLGIVLMGVRLNFALIAQAGPKVVALDLAIIVGGIAGIYWLTQKFGVSKKLGMLLAVGTSICGASAVAAAAPVTKADEDDVGLAVAMCGILGTAGVLIYVLAAPLLSLTTMQLAVLSGSTLHEVAQVMAASFSWGQEAGDMGTLVKLTRVVFLAPALIVLGFLQQGGGRMTFSLKEPPIPWFVIGFLAMGALNTFGIFSPAIASLLTQASVFLMTMAMAAMGLHTDLGMIRRTGMRALAAGFVGFGFLAVMSWSLIHAFNIQ